MIVVPLGPDRCDCDGAGEVAEADGDSVAVACDEDGVGEEPSGVPEISDIAGFDVGEAPHPIRSRQTKRTTARTLQVCVDVASPRPVSAACRHPVIETSLDRMAIRLDGRRHFQ
jgi:hypothetical protein